MQPCQAGSGTRSVLSGGLRAQHCRGSRPWPMCCLQRAPGAGNPISGFAPPTALAPGSLWVWIVVTPALGLPLPITCHPALLGAGPAPGELLAGCCEPHAGGARALRSPAPSEAAVSCLKRLLCSSVQEAPAASSGDSLAPLPGQAPSLLSVSVRACSPLGRERLERPPALRPLGPQASCPPGPEGLHPVHSCRSRECHRVPCPAEDALAPHLFSLALGSAGGACVRHQCTSRTRVGLR